MGNFRFDAAPGVYQADLTAAAQPFRLEDFAGAATFRGKPIFTPDQVIGQIDSGTEISGKTITFSFFDGPHTIGQYNNPHNGFTEPFGYSPFSEDQKDAARQAMVFWDDLIAPKIVEKNGNGADIVFANTTTGPAQAWTYYPGNGPKFQGDVWAASPSDNWTNAWLGFNGYGLTTLVHESGHALGLSHPGDYNFSDDNDGDGQPDPISYPGDAIYAQDSKMYSIMSYFEATETNGLPIDPRTGLFAQPQTPLLHDVLTIQAKYGADLTTRTGDTVYGYHSNAGNVVYDFNQNPSPYLTIYDAGGNDTLDLSGANAGVFLDLRPGAFSSAAARPTLAQANAAIDDVNAVTDDTQGDFAPWTDQAELDGFLGAVGNAVASRIASFTGVGGVQALSFQNISIAYNTIIENAIGGSARDYLVGNDVGNRLDGGAGNDVLDGLGGNDTLIGGTGADVFKFSTLGGTDRIADYGNGADTLNLADIDANTGVAGNQAFVRVAAFTHHAGELVLAYNAASNTTTMGLDVNGDGISDLNVLMGGNVSSTTGWIL